MSECPLCNGQRYLVVDNKVVDCECLRRKTILDVYRAAGIPMEFVDSTMEQFYRHSDADHKDLSPTDEKQKLRARNAVTSFIQQIPNLAEGQSFRLDMTRDGGSETFVVEGRNLALQGGYRSGKSLLAAIIAKESLRQGVRPHIMEWASIIDSCFDFDSGSVYDDMTHIFSFKKVLIIENVDSSYQPQTKGTREEPGKISPFAARRLDLLFMQRKHKQMPTVFTTSDDPKEFLMMPYGPIMRSILNDTIVIKLPSVSEAKFAASLKERIY